MIDILDEMKEKVVVVGLAHKQNPVQQANDSLNELAVLCESAGAKVVYSMLQIRPFIDSSCYIGKGKAEELAIICKELLANTVVFDDSLTYSQRNKLEKILNLKVLDRTQVILDIFAQRARSNEGKLQVELAQLKYLLARLIGKGTALSKLGGGIGTRGPGEQKLEVEKRLIKKRIQTITKELGKIIEHRYQQRQLRSENDIFTFSIVGYTNAGKTTLFNKLANLNSKTSNKLFTTLDPLIRRVKLPSGIDILISDTVGFIHKLPPELISAFKATLEEITYSDALIHVVDISNPEPESRIESVERILQEINADNKTKLLVFNKIDNENSISKINYLRKKYPDAVFISSKSGENIEILLQHLENIILNSWKLYNIKLSFIIAIIFHLIIMLIKIPEATHYIGQEPQKNVIILKKITPIAAQPRYIEPIKKYRTLPIPDPTPEEPEVIKENKIIEPKEYLFASSSGNDLFVNYQIPSNYQDIPVRIIEKGELAVLIHKVEAEYPEEARRARIEGVVILEAVINKDGTVGEIEIIKSAHPSLDEASIKAVKQYKFIPGKINGKPVRSFFTVSITFTLH